MEDDPVKEDKARRFTDWWTFCVNDDRGCWSPSASGIADDYRLFLDAVDRGDPDAIEKMTRYTAWTLSK